MDGSAARVLNSACALQRMQVRTLDGRYLGRVYDLRTQWRPGQPERVVVQCVVVGRSGWLSRVGIGRSPATVPWSAVRRIEGRTLWVDLPDQP